MENASHELTSQEVPQVEKSPCGRSYIKREELLQALPIGEDTGVSPGKPYHGQYHQRITTYGVPSPSKWADLKGHAL